MRSWPRNTPENRRWRPNPFEGEIGKISEVVEYKLEVNCKRELVNNALKVIKRAHPYENFAVNIFRLQISFETGASEQNADQP
ncbi:MAG: hypothetical protein IPN58_06865 [Anaerolineales bacterium]|nr:hypothetical protein [Anaerolineales bacterium]